MSDDDWQADTDDEQVEAWDGAEDARDDDMGDAWDADSDEERKKAEARAKDAAAGSRGKKLSLKQLSKRQEQLEREARQASEAGGEQAREASRMLTKKKIQEANEALIDDLFGEADFGGDEGDGKEESAPAVDGFDTDAVKKKANEALFGGESDSDSEDEKKDEAPMKEFSVATEEEVVEFANFVGTKIKTAKKTALIIKFLGEVLRNATEKFQMDDVKKVQKELNKIYNAKRVEYNQKKQAKRKKKPTLKMGGGKRGGGFDLDDRGGFDDDDFF